MSCTDQFKRGAHTIPWLGEDLWGDNLPGRLSCAQSVDWEEGDTSRKLEKVSSFPSFTIQAHANPLLSAEGLNGIRANVKAVQGELHFLEKGLIFISKQPILIDFSKTDSISFSRVGGGVASARTFDMRVVSKTGGANHVFSAINKQEVGPISSFLQSKNIRLKNEMEEATVDIDEPFSDDDEEMESPSEDERPSKAKNDKSKIVKKSADDDEDESGKHFLSLSHFSHIVYRLLTKATTDDEDFEDASSDGGSPSESDSDEDSGMASDASDPMMEELRKKNQAKRAKAKETSGSASEDEKPKKKKAKKEEDE